MIYWFLDDNNKVLNQIVFDDNVTNDLLNQVASINNASKWMTEQEYMDTRPLPPQDGKNYVWNMLLYSWVEEKSDPIGG